jgi:hypothetical protein
MKKFRVFFTLMLSIILLFSNSFTYAISNEDKKEIISKEASYLVGFKDNTDPEDFINKHFKNKKNKKIKKFKKRNTIITDLSQEDIDSIKNENEISFIEINANVFVEDTEKKPEIKHKEKDVKTDIVPWGITSIGGEIAQQNKYTGKSIKIAVLDTGVSEHADLKIKNGTSFVEGTVSYSDDNGHGTHVAGIIGADDNKSGIVGMAPDSEIYSVKVLDKNGEGTYSQVIEGIEWSIENDMDIISMSFGGNIYSRALQEAIQLATDNGILVIAAAGNNGNGLETELYPARYPEVISVGAITKYFTRAEFSSTGPSLDLVAPGTDIYSLNNDGEYITKSGTSMAVPHVTGAAALLMSSNKNLTREDVINSLYSTATPLGDKNDYGNGVVNIAKALGIINEAIPNPYEKNPYDYSLFDIKSIDSELMALNEKLTSLQKQALETGDIELAKDIENKDNELLIKSNKLHLLPTEFVTKNKDDILISSSIKAFYQEKSSEFLTLINEYKQVIEKFNNSKPMELASFENGIAGDYNFSTYPGNSHYQYMNPGDNDYYNFTAGTSGNITVSLSVPSDADYDLQALTPSGVVLASSTAGTGQSESLSFNVTAGSSYKIRVYYFSGNSGNYHLILSNITSPSPSIQPLYLNGPVDVSLGSGEYRVYSFTPSSSGNYKIFTGPYGGFGGANDTYLELYSNSNLTSEITRDDDSNGNSFSIIKTYLNAGTTYYIKLRHYSSTGSLYTRLEVQVDLPPAQPIYEDLPVDTFVNANEYKSFSFTPSESGKYRFFTMPYGGGETTTDTYLHLYSDSNLMNQLAADDDSNGQAQSEIIYELSAGTTYYIKFRGYNNNSANARLEVSRFFDWTSADYIDDNYLLSEYYIKENTYLTSNPQEAFVVENSQQSSYTLQEGDWRYIGVYPVSFLQEYDRDNGTELSAQSISLRNLKKYNLKQLGDSLFSKFMNYLNLPRSFNDPIEEEYFRQGAIVSVDDNIFFGLINKIKGLSKYEGDFYYLSGYQITSEAILAFYIQTSYSSAVQAKKTFLAASTLATSGALMAATGVGAIGGGIAETGALAAVARGSIASGISFVTGNLATRTTNFITSTGSKLTTVKKPTYNASNYANKFKQEIKPYPTDGKTYDIHHIFPQKASLKERFDEILTSFDGTIHNPNLLTYWEMSPHRSAAKAYNKRWEDFFAEVSSPTEAQVLQFGRQLCKEYGLEIHF